MDKDKIVSAYHTLSDRAAADFKVLLAFILADTHFTSPTAPPMYAPFVSVAALRQVAYMLATVKHECDNTWAPIEEYGRGKGKLYGKIDSRTGHAYYGRGYVQITFAENYKRIGQAIGVDLYHHPEEALKYDVAYKIMSYGMRKGAFTGVGLGKYINDTKTDYYNARRIINRLDCAEKIAGYARDIEMMLLGSL